MARPPWPERRQCRARSRAGGGADADRAAGPRRGRAAVPLGREQATALGTWFSRETGGHQPDVLLASPYLRARTTAEHFRAAGGCDAEEPICIDERLREKEFGVLDGLTTAGVATEFPDQAEFRRLLGKFYHRPPGGESWCDVIFRLRSLLDTVSLHYSGRRVMIVAHQVVVLCMRYIVENMSEAEILAIDHQGDVANCSITEYHFDPSMGRNGNLRLVRYNATAPMEAADARVTDAPDPPVAARG